MRHGTTNSSNYTYCDIQINYNGSSSAPKHIWFGIRRETQGAAISGHSEFSNSFDGKFHHIAVIGSVPDGFIKLYEDGISQTVTYTATDSGFTVADFEYPFYIGAMNYQGSVDHPLEGSVDEWRFSLVERKVFGDTVPEAII